MKLVTDALSRDDIIFDLTHLMSMAGEKALQPRCHAGPEHIKKYPLVSTRRECKLELCMLGCCEAI